MTKTVFIIALLAFNVIAGAVFSWWSTGDFTSAMVSLINDLYFYCDGPRSPVEDYSSPDQKSGPAYWFFAIALFTLDLIGFGLYIYYFR